MIISKKTDGPMKDKSNREIFLKKHNCNDIVLAEQVHGCNVEIVNDKHKGKKIKNTDGLITDKKALFLGITVADCLPITFFSKKITGVAHGGWRGLEKGIIEEALRKIEFLGERVEDVFFQVGPSIGPCHFEVKKDVIKKFKDFEEFLYKKEKGYFLDLKKIAEKKLRNLGAKNITVSRECTYCSSKKYYSFRRDKKINSMLVLNYPLKQ